MLAEMIPDKNRMMYMGFVDVMKSMSVSSSPDAYAMNKNRSVMNMMRRNIPAML